MRVCLVMLLCGTVIQLAALTAELGDILPDDRVVVTIRDIPVAVGLAHVALPDEAGLRSQAVAEIKRLAGEGSVQLIYKDAFGRDAGGVGRVYLRAGGSSINQLLVSEGLARFEPTGESSAYDMLMEKGQEQAKEAKKGIWAPSVTQVAKAEPEPPRRAAEPQRQSDPAAGASHCAELRGRYYYPVGDPAVASVDNRRLIFYRSEAEARKAGKRPAPTDEPIAKGGDNLATANAHFEKGREVYTRAVNLPATAERDELYDEAFRHLSRAVDLYNRLVQKSPGDGDLSEKLRRAAQLRYGAMKQRAAI